jgi:hypothetical protein
MRKTFNLPKAQTSVAPTATAAGRNEVKAKIAPVPKTAAGRLSEQTATKAKTSSEIIAGMAAARGKTRLTPAQKDS